MRTIVASVLVVVTLGSMIVSLTEPKVSATERGFVVVLQLMLSSGILYLAVSG